MPSLVNDPSTNTSVSTKPITRSAPTNTMIDMHYRVDPRRGIQPSDLQRLREMAPPVPMPTVARMPTNPTDDDEDNMPPLVPHGRQALNALAAAATRASTPSTRTSSTSPLTMTYSTDTERQIVVDLR